MNLAILANEKDSFVRPLAEGLARMTTACGSTAEIHYDGLEILSLPLGMREFSVRAIARYVLKSREYRGRFDDLVSRLSGADAIVVVTHVPASHSRHTLQNIELLRKRMPGLPIINYDLIYLPTVEKWAAAMLRGDMSDISPDEKRLIDPKPFGMERYDWYLVGSPVSEIPMPEGAHPYSRIGIDIDDGTLYPAHGGRFHVLLDFEQPRKDYPSFREIQIEALERSGVSFEILEGRFTRAEIRAKYRKAAVLLLAHRESFGLPLAEVQACGARIFAPRAEWAGAHWLKSDLSQPGPGAHSSNFVVYENTVEGLVQKLRAEEKAFHPARALATFRKFHPHFYRGDVKALADFLARLKSGAIHSRLHLQHAGVGA